MPVALAAKDPVAAPVDNPASCEEALTAAEATAEAADAALLNCDDA